MVEGAQVFQCCPVAEAILVLSLHHGRALCSQHLDCLEHVYHSLITHPLQYDTQSDEDSSATHTSTAVYRDRSILTKLLLGLVNLANELNEALARLRHPLLGPVCELELSYRP